MAIPENTPNIYSEINNYYKTPSKEGLAPPDALVKKVVGNLGLTTPHALGQEEKDVIQRLYTDISNTSCKDHPDWIDLLPTYRKALSLPSAEDAEHSLDTSSSGSRKKPRIENFSHTGVETSLSLNEDATLIQWSKMEDGTPKKNAYDRIKTRLDSENSPEEAPADKRRRISLDLSNLHLTELPMVLFTNPIFEDANLTGNLIEKFPEHLTLGSVHNIKNFKVVKEAIELNPLNQLSRWERLNYIDTLLIDEGCPCIQHLTGKDRIDDVLKRIALLMKFSDNDDAVNLCVDFVAYIQKNYPLAEELLRKNHLINFERPLIKLYKKDLSRFGNSSLLKELVFTENSKVIYISIHKRSFDYFQREDKAGEFIMQRIIESIKDDKPIDLEEFKRMFGDENYPDAVKLLFQIIDYFSLQDFQNKYLEPFNIHFPEIPLSKYPDTVQSLDLTSIPVLREEELNVLASIRENLRTIKIPYNFIKTNKEIFKLSEFRSLTSLTILSSTVPVRNLLNDLSPEGKAKITELHLSACNMKDLDLSQFTGLRTLHIVNPTGLVITALNSIPQAVRERLTELNLLNCKNKLTGINLSDFKELRILSIKNKRNDSGNEVMLNAVEILNTLSSAAKAKITALDLSGCNITGFDLDEFINLTKLNMAQTKGLVGNILNTLPEDVKGKIADLDLRNCSIIGLNLSKFTALTKLDFQNTRGSIETGLNTLTGATKAQITELNLSNRKIKDLNLAEFTNLTKLQVALAKGSIGAVLNTLPQPLKASITELDLSGCDITGLDFSEFKNLKKLNVAGARGSVGLALNTLPQSIKASITELDLSSCDITDLDFTEFMNLRKLNVAGARGPVGLALNTLHPEFKEAIKELDLTCCDIRGLDFRGFINLRKLNVDRAKGPVGLALSTLHLDCRQDIIELDLTCCDIRGLDFREFTKLTRLHIVGAKGPVGAALNTLPLAVKIKITELDLSGCDNIKDLSLTNFSNLKKFNYSNWMSPAGEGRNLIVSVLKTLSRQGKGQLENLTLEYCDIHNFDLSEYRRLNTIKIRNSNLSEYRRLNSEPIIPCGVGDIINKLSPEAKKILTSLTLIGCDIKNLNLQDCDNLERLNLKMVTGETPNILSEEVSQRLQVVRSDNVLYGGLQGYNLVSSNVVGNFD